MNCGKHNTYIAAAGYGGEGAYGSGKWNNTPVSAYTKEGDFIKSFESQKSCASYFNTSSSNVKQAVNGRIVLLCKKISNTIW